MHRRTFLIAIGAGGLLAAVSAMAAPAVADSPAGTPGNGASSQAAVSTTGRYVVFRSVATNLVSGDTNGKADIFIRDRVANTTKRVSVTSGGAQANADSSRPSVSWDGRYVVFLSAASNLVPGDTNGKVDAYRKDLATGRLVRINTSAAGAQANAAADTVRVSADGNRIVFATTASNLVAGDNRPGDVFLRDMAAGALKGSLKQSRRLRISTTTTASLPTSRPTARSLPSRRSTPTRLSLVITAARPGSGVLAPAGPWSRRRSATTPRRPAATPRSMPSTTALRWCCTTVCSRSRSW